MGVRKNAKYLTASEKEDFVRACVLLKADIVNQNASPADRYSRWDEYVAIHWMIQRGVTPGGAQVNFGHGGPGAFSFLSWHRYFLYQFEKQLQSHVPGVMLPYWDWTDPAPIMTDTFLGPNGDPATTFVTRGYFAGDAPGTGSNSTPAPAWWPATLSGWNLHAAFGPPWAGPLRRQVGLLVGLPTMTDIRETLNKTTYDAFQAALESGTGLTSLNPMHGGLHGYIGGQMGNALSAPFDPIFYLHHCNVDRLWAMWQMDGHADTYPSSGGNPEHHRNDVMYPWTGGIPGFGTGNNLPPFVMPDYSALGTKRNVDALDHRALGYTYDTMPIVGVSLDRSGSMNQLTPDPMTTGAPDVTKWEAACRGVSAFLHDCEAAYASKEAYVFAGVETFRATNNNQFLAVFGMPPADLIKAGGAHSDSAFQSAVASLSVGGLTPLADALTHADATLVKAPFGDAPAAEPRYLAILTDGLRTAGATVASIPNGSLGDTAVFAMGFGTAADVDYATIGQLVAKGTSLPTNQLFHGENAGTIDKFYTNTLAAAIGYTPIVDPVVELLAGEYTHIDFYATSAEDAFFITAQGMDFSDRNWTYHLTGPDGTTVYTDVAGHTHSTTGHCHPAPTVSVKRGNGRLSLFMNRDSAPAHAWVGKWQLMVAYKARAMDRMVMQTTGSLLAPVSAGPLRGPHYDRLLSRIGTRVGVRTIVMPNQHPLQLLPPLTTGDHDDACNVTVNIYARTRLQVNIATEVAEKTTFHVEADAQSGMVSNLRAFGRLLSSRIDVAELLSGELASRITRGTSLRGSRSLKYDSTKLLRKLERQDEGRFQLNDEIVTFEFTEHNHAQLTVPRLPFSGLRHLGVMVEGVYSPESSGDIGQHGAHERGAHHGPRERFERILAITAG